MDVDDGPPGYPGFQVHRPARLRDLPITLRRIAWAKLTGIRFFSVDVGGESHLFEPWLTVFLEERDRMRFVGVYRTDDDRPDDAAAEPRLCLRHSLWERSVDLAQAQDAGDLRSYLATGPQITDRFVVTNRVRHPPIAEVTEAAIAALAGGVTLTPARRPDAAWHYVDVDVADEEFLGRFAYGPATARSAEIESAVAAWLPAVEHFASEEGMPREGPVRLSVEYSVPELVSAPLWSPRRRVGDPGGGRRARPCPPGSS